jgi:hypothetical protein
MTKSACHAETSAQAGVGQSGFHFGQNVFKAWPSLPKTPQQGSCNPAKAGAKSSSMTLMVKNSPSPAQCQKLGFPTSRRIAARSLLSNHYQELTPLE